MREIKFRGKNENGWHYGLLTFMFNSYAISHVEDENTVDLIDRETVGQYTGLKDKNGVEIYEGDVVIYEDGENSFKGVVDEDCYLFYIKGKYDNYSFDDVAVAMTGTSDLKVIGNIYENKELLNG